MSRPPPLNALRSFEAAARLLSFRRAAEELNVTPAAISQQIKLLESHLGTPLFHRRTRAIELTEAGFKLLPLLQDGFSCIAQAVSRITEVDTSEVAVAAPPAFAAKWLSPRIPAFMSSHPGVNVRVTGGIEVSPLRQTGSPRNDDAVDLAIRFGSGRYPQCQVERLFPVTLIPLCSPILLQRQELATPSDLAHHTLLHNDARFLGHWRPSWEIWLKTVGASHVDSTRGIRFNNTLLTMEAALDGSGVALGIAAIADGELSTGRLVAPFAQEAPTPFAYYVVTPESGGLSHAARAFREWLLAQGRQDEGQHSTGVR